MLLGMGNQQIINPILSPSESWIESLNSQLINVKSWRVESNHLTEQQELIYKIQEKGTERDKIIT